MLPKLKKQYLFLHLWKKPQQPTSICIYFYFKLFLLAFSFTYHMESTQNNPRALFAHVQRGPKSQQPWEVLPMANID